MDYICVDCSGSTGNQWAYWQKVKEIVNNNGNNGNAKYLCWDDSCRWVTKQQLIDRANMCTGGGGTSPSCFANKLPENVSVTIITDGQVGHSEVFKCDTLLKERKFKRVAVHFIKTDGQMNLSVAAPFTRNTEYEIHVDGKVHAAGNSGERIDLNKYRNNPDLFISEAEKVYQQIIMQNLGKTNVQLRNDLLDLQKNLLRYIANEGSKENQDSFAPLRDAIKANDLIQTVALLRNVTSGTDNTPAKKVESIIQECIKKCDSKDFSFDVLTTGRLGRANVVQPVFAEELPEEENYTGSFECPIFLDQDIPVCLVANGPPILADLDKNYLNSIMNMPLFVLNNVDLVKALKERIDHLIGLKSLKELYGNGSVISPFTRRPISSVLTFSSDVRHYKNNKYALANLLFGQKLVGNPVLWMAVLYFVIRDIEYLKRPDFLTLFEGYLKKQLTESKINITLTGLPIAPFVKVPIDIALWYCLHSPIVNDQLGLDEESNRLRAFGNTSFHFMTLLDLLGYPYHKTDIEHKIKVYSVFTWMMIEEKANSNWRNLLRAQYQNYIVLDDKTVILLDGPTTTPLPVPQFQGLPLAELIGLSKLVNRRKTNGVIPLPDSFDSVVPVSVTNYTYPANLKGTDFYGETLIHPRTYRPYTKDQKSGSDWQVEAEAKFGPLKGQLHAYNYFIRYVDRYNKYPTGDEYIKYMADRQANHKDTLPRYIRDTVIDVFSSYEKVLGNDFTNVPVETFIEVTNSSRPQKIRYQLEQL